MRRLLLGDRPWRTKQSTERCQHRHRHRYRPSRHRYMYRRQHNNACTAQLLASVRTVYTSCLLLICIPSILPSPAAASPLECGKILTTPCVSWSDPRYNPHQLPSLAAQNSLWSKASGLWIISHQAYEPSGQPKSNSPYTAQGSFPYRRDAYLTFRNVTLTDTRLYVREINVYRPPSQSSSDCWMSNIPNSPQKHYGDAIGSSNSGGTAGETDGGDAAAAAAASGAPSSSSARKNCGTHGSMSYREIFGTASPEKDGTINTFWLNDMEYGTIMDYHHGPTGEGSTVRPIRNDTMLYRLSTGDGGMLSTWTDVLTANHRLEGSGTRIVAHDDDNNGRTDTTHILSNATRSVFEDGWTKDLLRAMHEANIPDQERMTLSLRLSRHHSDGCLFGQYQCPSDEDFCALGQDPACDSTSSPYQEPVAGVRIAAVLSISLVCAITALTLGVKAHRHILYTQLTSQELHHRDSFVGQVARRIDMRTSTSQLPAEKLTAMVLHIADGLREASPEHRPIIGKEELWEFMASGVAGKMYEIDFDLLFRAIDVRALGRIDFVDYIVYLSMCGKSFSEIDEALFDAAVDEEEIIERACKRIASSWGADREKDHGSSGIAFNFPSM